MNEFKDRMEADAGAALRRCAMALHAIGSRDREWILGKLPAVQRAGLEQLVGELQELGMPPDERVAQEVLARNRGTRRTASPEVAGGQRRVEPAGQATSADASDMARVLEHEPAALIAHVLALHDTVGQAVLGHLSASKRRQVQQLSPVAGSDTVPPAALSLALQEELAKRLSHLPRKVPARRFALAAKVWPLWSGHAGRLQ